MKCNKLKRNTGKLPTMGKSVNILAHEIRNGLAVISNSLFLLKKHAKKSSLDNNFFGLINIMECELVSVSRTTTDMLNFSRNRSPVLSSINIGNLIKKILNSLKIPENIKIDLSISDTPNILVDIEELKQVIRNIINNAVESMEKKKTGLLKIKIFQNKKAKIPLINFEISDTGCGISKQHLKHIFDPYYSTKPTGTGLGLSISGNIIEKRHNGKINIKSTVEKGTTVTIALPIK